MQDTLCAHLHHPAPATFIVQDWAAYTDEKHLAWSMLYERRMATLRDTGSRVFLEGAATIGLGADRVPDLADVNRAARRSAPAGRPSGVAASSRRAVLRLSRRAPLSDDAHRAPARAARLPARARHLPRRVRPRAAARAIPCSPTSSSASAQSAAARAHRGGDEAMARLFWFTVEFGLVQRRRAQVKVYGTGLISSHGDAANALGAEVRPAAVRARRRARAALRDRPPAGRALRRRRLQAALRRGGTLGGPAFTRLAREGVIVGFYRRVQERCSLAVTDSACGASVICVRGSAPRTE